MRALRQIPRSRQGFQYYALWVVAISLLLLAFPAIAIIGLVVALKTRERLRLVEVSVEKLARGLAATEAAAAREPRPTVGTGKTVTCLEAAAGASAVLHLRARTD